MNDYQIFEFYPEISSYVNDRKQVDAVFVNLSNPFNKVPHRKLVNVLLDLGVSSCLIRWINRYMTNCQQFMDISGTDSGMLDVYFGVRKRSVLGLLHFFGLHQQFVRTCC